jgi:hypothetical protein
VSNGSAIKALDLSEYSNGVYVIQFSLPNGIFIEKLIKE